MTTVDDPQLRVFMCPDYTGANPYQEGLIDGLARANVDTIRVDANGMFPLLSAWIAYDRPDLVHVHWIHRFIEADRHGKSLLAVLLAVRSLVEILLLRIAGIPVVWTIHNVASHEREVPHVEMAFRHIVSRLVAGMIVHCDDARDIIIDRYRLPARRVNRIHVIPHGNYDDHYPRELDRAEARQALQADPDRTVLLFFGMIRRYKRVPALVDTFAAIDDPETELWIVGNPWSDALKREVERAAAGQRNVNTVLEYVDDSQVQTFFSAADATVLPYDGILTSGSAILAMTYGRAVIAPASGCLPELIGEFGGITYDSDTPHGLATSIQAAIADRDRLHRMGERNRRVASRLCWSSIGEQTATVYRSAIR